MKEFGCLREFHHPDIVTSARFHPTAAGVLATACADGKVRLWDCAMAERTAGSSATAAAAAVAVAGGAKGGDVASLAAGGRGLPPSGARAAGSTSLGSGAAGALNPSAPGGGDKSGTRGLVAIAAVPQVQGLVWGQLCCCTETIG